MAATIGIVNGDPQRDSAGWLANVSEVERHGGWSLRSGLVRYAQAQPVRAGALLEVVRRLEAALAPHRTGLEQGRTTATDDPAVEALLEVAAVIDELADLVAVWAEDPRSHVRPDAALDRCVTETTARMDALGVAREVRDPAEWARVRRRSGA